MTPLTPINPPEVFRSNIWRREFAAEGRRAEERRGADRREERRVDRREEDCHEEWIRRCGCEWGPLVSDE
jgi:hypothetical protein